MPGAKPSSVALPPWTAKRRPRAQYRAAANQQARAIGSLILAWNEANGSLFDVYRWTVAEADFAATRHVWLALQSDDLRRKVIRAAASTLDHRKALYSGLVWALDQLDRANEQRKFAVHVYLRGWGEHLEPDYFTTDDGKLNKHERAPWLADAAALTGDLYAIADYIRGIGMAFGPGGRAYPYVRRPVLRSRRLADAAKSALAAKKKADRQARRTQDRPAGYGRSSGS